MAFEPGREFCPRHSPSGKARHQLLLRINRRFDGDPVQIEEHGHRGVGDAFVAVDEGVVHSQAEGQRTGFLHHGMLQVCAVEGRFGLGQRRLEGTEIADPVSAPVAARTARWSATTSPSVR